METKFSDHILIWNEARETPPRLIASEMPGNRVKKSKVWLHFDDVGGKGRCKHCAKSIATPGGTTSTLIKHLLTVHKDRVNVNDVNPCKVFPPAPVQSKPKELNTLPSASDASLPSLPSLPTPPDGITVDPDQADLPQNDGPKSETPSKTASHPPPFAMFAAAAANARKRKLSPDDSNRISRFITRYIVLSMQPYSTIEDKHFREMVSALCPEFQCPNRSTLSDQYIPAWYDQVKADLVRSLDSVQFVAITSDGWTSVSQDHFLTVTASFIKDWTLETKVLSTKAVYVSQTGENVSIELNDVLSQFGIKKNKIVAATVDNAANMDVAVRNMDILKIGCFSHTLNVAVQKVYELKCMKQWLPHIRSIIVWFRRVHMAKVVLTEWQKRLQIPELCLILDVRTRWNSLFAISKSPFARNIHAKFHQNWPSGFRGDVI